MTSIHKISNPARASCTFLFLSLPSRYPLSFLFLPSLPPQPTTTHSHNLSTLCDTFTMPIYVTTSKITTCEGTIHESLLPETVKVSSEDQNLDIPTDTNYEGTYTSMGFTPTIDLYSSGVILAIERLIIRNPEFPNETLTASSSHLKLDLDYLTLI